MPHNRYEFSPQVKQGYSLKAIFTGLAKDFNNEKS